MLGVVCVDNLSLVSHVRRCLVYFSMSLWCVKTLFCCKGIMRRTWVNGCAIPLRLTAHICFDLMKTDKVK